MDILNDILSALSIGLDALFPNIPIYPEVVPGQLPTRCFLIGFAGEVAVKRELTEHTTVSGKLDITYLPPQKQDEPEQRREMNRMFASLALNLETIRCQDLILQLRNHTRQGAEDELHDICAFKVFLFRADNIPLMREISINKEELT